MDSISVRSMNIVYAPEVLPTSTWKSIFLAGPTPRDKSIPSWRPEALKILAELGFDGNIYVPERRDASPMTDYTDQVEWENEAMNRSDVILFWVPRDMKTMPALTTNHERGEWFASGKTVMGAPSDAAHVRYLIYKGGQYFEPQSNDLRETIKLAMEMIGAGAFRIGGEAQIPLYIWQTPSFQDWYLSQKRAGNVLESAKAELVLRAGPQKRFVFMWILHVNIYVGSERRNKKNEVVIARPDVAALLMYHREPNVMDTKIVEIKEFRSPAATADGFVHELPSGSSFDPRKTMTQLASDEAFEETALRIDPFRLTFIGARQIAATLSAHKAHLFAVELTAAEYAFICARLGQTQSDGKPSGELTYTGVVTLKEVLLSDLYDWSTVGMIARVLWSFQQ